MHRKKVMILTSSHTIGGFETRLDTIISHLNKKKFDVSFLLIYPFYKARRVPEKVRIQHKKRLVLQKKGIHTIEVVMKRRYDLFIIREVIRQMRMNKVEILFFFALGAGTFIAPISGRLAGVPRIIRVSGTIIHRLYPCILRPLDRILISVTDVIVTPSQFMKNILIRELKVKPKKVRVIQNGIDTKRFSQRYPTDVLRKELEIGKDAHIVGIVANLVPIKAHTVLLHAVPRVLKRFPNTYFILVGEGPLKGELKALTDTLRCRSSVKFMGYRSDIEKIISIFDIGVLCSKVETFGNSLLEIASAGKPVIASRVGGIPEIVQQGVNGLLVKQGDSEALANAMIRLLGDPVLAGQLGKRGKELACKYYSKESMVGRLEDLFLSPDMKST